jgi:hypothetical protein
VHLPIKGKWMSVFQGRTGSPPVNRNHSIDTAACADSTRVARLPGREAIQSCIGASMAGSERPGTPGNKGPARGKASRTRRESSLPVPPGASGARAGGAPLPRFGFVHLLYAIADYAKSARCANDLDRLVVLERMRQEFETEPETLLQRGFDKAYRQVMEGV